MLTVSDLEPVLKEILSAAPRTAIQATPLAHPARTLAASIKAIHFGFHDIGFTLGRFLKEKARTQLGDKVEVVLREHELRRDAWNRAARHVDASIDSAFAGRFLEIANNPLMQTRSGSNTLRLVAGAVSLMGGIHAETHPIHDFLRVFRSSAIPETAIPQRSADNIARALGDTRGALRGMHLNWKAAGLNTVLPATASHLKDIEAGIRQALNATRSAQALAA